MKKDSITKVEVVGNWGFNDCHYIGEVSESLPHGHGTAYYTGSVIEINLYALKHLRQHRPVALLGLRPLSLHVLACRLPLRRVSG